MMCRIFQIVCAFVFVVIFFGCSQPKGEFDQVVGDDLSALERTIGCAMPTNSRLLVAAVPKEQSSAKQVWIVSIPAPQQDSDLVQLLRSDSDRELVGMDISSALNALQSYIDPDAVTWCKSILSTAREHQEVSVTVKRVGNDEFWLKLIQSSQGAVMKIDRLEKAP